VGAIVNADRQTLHQLAANPAGDGTERKRANLEHENTVSGREIEGVGPRQPHERKCQDDYQVGRAVQ